MGDSYREFLREQGKKAKNSRVSWAVTWPAANARAKVRAKHARESRERHRKMVSKAAGQEEMI